MKLGKITHKGYEVHCFATPRHSTRAQIGEDVEQKGELASEVILRSNSIHPAEPKSLKMEIFFAK